MKKGKVLLRSFQELSVKEIWENEIARCILLGFHKALGLTKQQFTNRDFFPLPEEKPNPLAIIPETIFLNNRIKLTLDISEQMKWIKVNGESGTDYLTLTEHKDLIEIPDRIHWIYRVEDGSRFAVSEPLTAPEQEEKILKKQKRTPFATVHGISLVRRFPEVLNHHYLNLPGSRYGFYRFLSMCFSHDGRPILSPYNYNNRFSGVPSFYGI